MRKPLAVLVLLASLGVAVALAAVRPTALPLGDGKVTTSGPKRGWIYSCGVPGGGPVTEGGPWINGPIGVTPAGLRRLV
jgi:hypothetical protein